MALPRNAEEVVALYRAIHNTPPAEPTPAIVEMAGVNCELIYLLHWAMNHSGVIDKDLPGWSDLVTKAINRSTKLLRQLR